MITERGGMRVDVAAHMVETTVTETAGKEATLETEKETGDMIGGMTETGIMTVTIEINVVSIIVINV